jgi:hypothetical protein
MQRNYDFTSAAPWCEAWFAARPVVIDVQVDPLRSMSPWPVARLQHRLRRGRGDPVAVLGHARARLEASGACRPPGQGLLHTAPPAKRRAARSRRRRFRQERHVLAAPRSLATMEICPRRDDMDRIPPGEAARDAAKSEPPAPRQNTTEPPANERPQTDTFTRRHAPRCAWHEPPARAVAAPPAFRDRRMEGRTVTDPAFADSAPARVTGGSTLRPSCLSRATREEPGAAAPSSTPTTLAGRGRKTLTPY